jgi:hypothetical protein
MAVNIFVLGYVLHMCCHANFFQIESLKAELREVSALHVACEVDKLDLEMELEEARKNILQ